MCVDKILNSYSVIGRHTAPSLFVVKFFIRNFDCNDLCSFFLSFYFFSTSFHSFFSSSFSLSPYLLPSFSQFVKFRAKVEMQNVIGIFSQFRFSKVFNEFWQKNPELKNRRNHKSIINK